MAPLGAAPSSYDVVVIGGGIIGVACALELLAAGRSVAIVEPAEPGAGTAGGSAGYLSDGEIFPLAQPGVLAGLPSLLLDPRSPLVVSPAALPSLVGWGVRFIANARPARVRSATAALASLNRLANEALFALAERAGAAAYLRREGALHVAKAPAAFARARAVLPILAEYGLVARSVERDELLRLEPALSPDVSGAVEYPNSMRCTDPAAFGEALAQRARRLGAEVIRSRVLGLEAATEAGMREAWRLRTSAGPVHAARIVVSAGIWSRALLRPLGYIVPLQAARGYHLMLPQAKVAPRRTLLFEDAHFCATPMDWGLRLAGTMEFARLGSPPNYARSDLLFPAAAEYLPGLSRDGATRWMGNRPSFPDSLPAIGAAARHRNLYYCFGHEKLGLTQAAVSAQAIAALLCGRAPAVDLRPFALERFL